MLETDRAAGPVIALVADVAPAQQRLVRRGMEFIAPVPTIDHLADVKRIVFHHKPNVVPEARVKVRIVATSGQGVSTAEKALDALGTNDILILPEWDRCTRSMTEGIAIIERVHKRGTSVKVLHRDYLDLTKPINCGILAFLSALAEAQLQFAQARRPAETAKP